ncbi:MAG: dimethyl sulfoxide reductase anchor subunit family protein [Rhodosalinus sp.]
MHPAPSLLIFTTLSGAGLGFLFFLGLGMPAPTGWVAFGYFALAYALAAGGLSASAFHLGHPERALKAFTQWRSSWLSREAWAAVATLVVMALYGTGLVFFGARLVPLGWIGAGLALATVVTTSMIYTQMKAVPRWHTPLTPALFLAISLAGGALFAGESGAALGLLVIALALQLAWWVRGDGAFAASGTDMGTATGLGTRGRLRSFEPPHTGPNYLLREMVFVVGRRHATRLRVAAVILMTILPLILLSPPFGKVGAGLAALVHLCGVAVSRWLFFAEAEHVVGLYYGAR